MNSLTWAGLLAANPVWDAFRFSDFMGQAIVLGLFIGSAYVWTIMLDKAAALNKAMADSESFKEIFRSKRLLLNAFPDAKANAGPLADIFLKGAGQILTYFNIGEAQAAHYGSEHCPAKSLTTAQIETVRTVLDRSVSDRILEFEDKMGFLANAVSVSPLMGLFGTVWGVMIAFCGIAMSGKPNIADMAPGISGALLTTVAGLMVAIPSSIGYNILTNKIRKLTVYMDNFVDEFMSKIKLEQHAAAEAEANAAFPSSFSMPRQELDAGAFQKVILEHHVRQVPPASPAPASPAPAPYSRY